MKVNPWFVVAVSVLTTLLYHALVPRTVEAHSYSGAPSFTTWSANQKLTSTDLNNTMAHLHNTFSGNIDDTMISTAAAIQHSKLQYPILVPKAAAYVAPNCTTASCTLAFTSRIATIARSGAGNYIVTLTYTAPNNVFGIVTTPATGGTAITCISTAVSTSTYGIACVDAAGVAQDTGFMTTVYDDDN